MTISARKRGGSIRIAILAPEFFHAWGGVGSYTHALVKGLIRIPGIEIHIITPDIKDKDKRQDIEKRYQGKAIIHTLSVADDTFIYNLKFQLALWRGFSKLHARYGFDLVHSSNLVHMPDIFLKSNRFRIPSLVTVHTTIEGQVKGTRLSGKRFFKMAMSEKLSLLTYPYIRFMERRYMRYTDEAIVVSKRYARLIKKGFGFNGPIKVIPNSIDLEDYSPSRMTDKNCLQNFPDLRKRKKITILFAGRLIALKGIDVLMKAISDLEKGGDSFTYLIAGRGEKRFLDGLKKRYGIENADIRYLGHVGQERLPFLYHLSDIFVLPSFNENLPITLMEAMASGCVPIASDVGSVDEIITDMEDGILVKPGNHTQLASRMRLISKDKVLRMRLGRAGMRKARALFSNTLMAERTHKVYKGLVQRVRT